MDSEGEREVKHKLVNLDMYFIHALDKNTVSSSYPFNEHAECECCVESLLRANGVCKMGMCVSTRHNRWGWVGPVWWTGKFQRIPVQG